VITFAPEGVFPSETATFLDPSNLHTRYFQPAIEKAGLRHFRIHDLRHTFASLLLQDGASLTYVRDQLGHSSISITVDLYGHLVPGANIAWVDRLDEKKAGDWESGAPNAQTNWPKSANQAQTPTGHETMEDGYLAENNGGPGQSRTADQRFRKPLLYPSELQGHEDVTS